MQMFWFLLSMFIAAGQNWMYYLWRNIHPKIGVTTYFYNFCNTIQRVLDKRCWQLMCYTRALQTDYFIIFFYFWIVFPMGFCFTLNFECNLNLNKQNDIEGKSLFSRNRKTKSWQRNPSGSQWLMCHGRLTDTLTHKQTIQFYPHISFPFTTFFCIAVKTRWLDQTW